MTSARYVPASGETNQSKVNMSIQQLNSDLGTAETNISGLTTLLTQNSTIFNLTVAASVSSNNLTVAIKTLAGTNPSSTDVCYVSFPSGTGSYVKRTITGALSFTVNSGATLGTNPAGSDPCAAWVVLFDDGGTLRVGVVQCSDLSGVFPLCENVPVSSTGGTGGSSPGVFYTGTAVSSKYFRIIARMEWTSGITAAGVWNVAPDIVKLYTPGMKLPGDVVGLKVGGTSSIVTSSSTTLIDTGLSIAITPTSKANIIRITPHENGIYPNATTNGAKFAVFRGSTNIHEWTVVVGYGSQTVMSTSTIAFDKPNTTSSTTYKTQFAANAGSMSVQNNSDISTIIVEEIQV